MSRSSLEAKAKDLREEEEEAGREEEGRRNSASKNLISDRPVYDRKTLSPPPPHSLSSS